MGRKESHLDIAQLPDRIALQLGRVFPEISDLRDVYARLPTACRPLSGLQSILRQQLGYPFTDGGPPPLHERPFDDVFVAASVHLAHAEGVDEVDLAALYLLTRLAFVLKASRPPDLSQDRRLADFRFLVLGYRLENDVRSGNQLSDKQLAELVSRAQALSESSWATRGRPIFRHFPSTRWQLSGGLKSRYPRRLEQALIGRQKTDGRIIRSDEELRGLMTLIEQRVERQKAAREQLRREIRRVYGLSRRTQVMLPERLSRREPHLTLTAAAVTGPQVVIFSPVSKTDYLWPFNGTSFYPSR